MATRAPMQAYAYDVVLADISQSQGNYHALLTQYRVLSCYSSIWAYSCIRTQRKTKMILRAYLWGLSPAQKAHLKCVLLTPGWRKYLGE